MIRKFLSKILSKPTIENISSTSHKKMSQFIFTEEKVIKRGTYIDMEFSVDGKLLTTRHFVDGEIVKEENHITNKVTTYHSGEVLDQEIYVDGKVVSHL